MILSAFAEAGFYGQLCSRGKPGKKRAERRGTWGEISPIAHKRKNKDVQPQKASGICIFSFPLSFSKHL